MKACAIRSLPDVGLDIAHIERSRNAVRRAFRRRSTVCRPPVLKRRMPQRYFAQPKTGQIEAAIQI